MTASRPRRWDYKLKRLDRLPAHEFEGGEPFDAASVKFSIARYLDPATRFPGMGYIASLERADVVDDRMVVAPAITREETRAIVAYHIRIPKGVRIPHSYHKVAHEVIFVLAGRGTAHLNDRKVPLRAGDVILVRPRTWHSFETKGRSLEFLAIAAPRVDAKTDLYYR